MTGKEESKGDSSATAKLLHPVYSVTNIQNKVRVLDGSKVTYSSWTKLFTLHCKGYKVLHHIDGTKPPEEADPAYESWVEIDSIVLQWIYGTLSDDLLVRILDANITAREAWIKIHDIFLNNKGSRAAALEAEFTSLTLSACSTLEAYCQKLKNLAEQLKDVEHPVDEKRLVVQLVRGLPSEYDITASLINQCSPSWDVAIGMLQLEQQRQSARQNPTNSILMAAGNNRPPNPQQNYQHRNGDGRQYQHSNRGGGRGRSNNNRGGRSNNNQQRYNNHKGGVIFLHSRIGHQLNRSLGRHPHRAPTLLNSPHGPDQQGHQHGLTIHHLG